MQHLTFPVDVIINISMYLSYLEYINVLKFYSQRSFMKYFLSSRFFWRWHRWYLFFNFIVCCLYREIQLKFDDISSSLSTFINPNSLYIDSLEYFACKINHVIYSKQLFASFFLNVIGLSPYWLARTYNVTLNKIGNNCLPCLILNLKTSLY